MGKSKRKMDHAAKGAGIVAMDFIEGLWYAA
jgi:hypothetical protein